LDSSGSKPAIHASRHGIHASKHTIEGSKRSMHAAKHGRRFYEPKDAGAEAKIRARLDAMRDARKK
jgi:hypothetical protein